MVLGVLSFVNNTFGIPEDEGYPKTEDVVEHVLMFFGCRFL